MSKLIDKFNRTWTATEGGCWEWTAHRNPKGYGRVRNGARMDVAHRVAWEIHNGAIPDGMCVCHRCDNPPCVNPAHLFLGTRSDNHADMVKKGRQAHGVRLRQSKLSPDKVREIRNSDASAQELASAYGVTASAIRYVKRGDTWKAAA